MHVKNPSQATDPRPVSQLTQ